VTTSSPERYAPRVPTLVDTVSYTNRLVDQILRTNPLTNASVSSGLIRWLGNYFNGDGSSVNFLWIGEFFPADPNLPGSPPQRGFSLVRDDSRGGVSAIALYDASPGLSPGLKQTLFFTSGDGKRLMEESRDGGQRWPETSVVMGSIGSDAGAWPGVNNVSPAYGTIWEGRFPVMGNRLHYRFFIGADSASSGNFRMRVEMPGGDITGAVYNQPAAGTTLVDDSIDVSAARGLTVRAFWEGSRTGGAGFVRSTPLAVRCYTP
jgi:hypothetical protein